MLDLAFEQVERAECLAPELDQRIALGDPTQADAAAHDIHMVDVVLPEGIHDLQHHHALELAHVDLARLDGALVLGDLYDVCLLRRVGGARGGAELLDQRVALQPIDLLGEDVVRDLDAPHVKLLDQAIQIPILGKVRGRVPLHHAANLVIHHFEHALVHVLALEHRLAIRINDLTLGGDHVVIFHDVLADIEVEPLDLRLRLLDEARHHFVLDRHIVGHADALKQSSRAARAKAAHQVILQRDEEARLARVALPPGTAAQLIVDATRLVPLSTDDVEAARRKYLLAVGLADLTRLR